MAAMFFIDAPTREIADNAAAGRGVALRIDLKQDADDLSLGRQRITVARVILDRRAFAHPRDPLLPIASGALGKPALQAIDDPFDIGVLDRSADNSVRHQTISTAIVKKLSCEHSTSNFRR